MPCWSSQWWTIFSVVLSPPDPTFPPLPLDIYTSAPWSIREPLFVKFHPSLQDTSPDRHFTDTYIGEIVVLASSFFWNLDFGSLFFVAVHCVLLFVCCGACGVLCFGSLFMVCFESILLCSEWLQFRFKQQTPSWQLLCSEWKHSTTAWQVFSEFQVLDASR